MKPNKEILEDWRTNSKYWKWGLFYVNKEDDRLLVDKPNPYYGTTLNFAHKASYLILLFAFSFFGFIIYMMTKNQ